MILAHLQTDTREMITRGHSFGTVLCAAERSRGDALFLQSGVARLLCAAIPGR